MEWPEQAGRAERDRQRRPLPTPLSLTLFVMWAVEGVERGAVGAEDDEAEAEKHGVEVIDFDAPTEAVDEECPSRGVALRRAPHCRHLCDVLNVVVPSGIILPLDVCPPLLAPWGCR